MLNHMITFTVILYLVPTALAAGGQSIFKLGDYVDKKPFEVMAMYFTVFAITIIYEWIVAYVDKSVTTHSGKNIVHHVYSEVMILGGISALLTVFENLGGTAYFEAALFHFVHFVIFVMALFFIGLIGSLFFFIDSSWKAWSRFEFQVTEIENEPSLTLESKSAFLQQRLKQVPDSQRMLACLIYYRQNLPMEQRHISFSRYMKKKQRTLLLSFLDLEWKTWGLLSVLCTLAAIVTWITLKISSNDLATIGLWVLFVGFGPLLVLIVTYFKVRKEFHTFTNWVQEMRQQPNGENNEREKDTFKQNDLFWWSPGWMRLMMQTMLVYQVFYLANCAVNFTYRLYQISYGVALVLLCFLPSFFVFIIMIPNLLPKFTILSSLGMFLGEDTLHRIQEADENCGKYRRRLLRERMASEPAAFLVADDGNILGLDHYDEEQHGHGHKHGDERLIISDEGILPLDPHHGHGHGHDHGHDAERPDVICEECSLSPAAVTCGICGILCNNCKDDYHKLKKFRDHHVIKLKNSLFAPKKPLLTDNPIINKDRTAASLYKKTGAIEEVAD